MADFVAQVDLSEQAEDYRRLALQPGMGLLDKGGSHAAILRKWLGSNLAVPVWDGYIVKFQLRDEDGGAFEPKRFQMLTAADCQGAFRSELEGLAKKLETAPARTGTERALRHVMLDRLKKLQADPKQAAQSGVLAKYLDHGGVWRLVWLWGFERKSSEAGTPVICRNPDCRTLAVLTEDRRVCPRCDAKLKAARSPLPVLAAVLAFVLIGGGIAYWLTQKPAEMPRELAAVNGRVLSAVGQKPVRDAKVRLEREDVEVQTDADGRFRLEDFPLEPSTLVITAPGFLEAKHQVDPSELGKNLLNVPLQGRGSIRGVVRDEINHMPIAGAMIALPDWGVSAETDREGIFQIADVPARPMQVEVSAAGYEAVTVEETASAETQEPLEVRLAGTGKLVGRVTDALTLGPVSNATVYLLNTPLTTKTGSDGRFEIAGISTGKATIAVQATGYQTESSEQELKATETRPFLVGLHGAGVIRGRVVAEATGEPVGKANVEIAHPEFDRSVKTNSRGEFEILKLPPAELSLKVFAEGFEESEKKATATEAGEPVEISLIGNAGLTGTVTDAVENQPIPNVKIRIAGTELSTETGEDGTYRLAQIPGRQATVQVVGRGYRQQEFQENFQVGEEKMLNVELKGGTILAGVVQDALSESPIVEAEVEVVGTSQKSKTDEEGRFRFEDLMAGPRSLKISASGYHSVEKETELETDQEAQLKIGLKGDAVLSGTVVGAAGEKPLSGVQVAIAGGPRQIQTDENGSFRFENVPSGFHELEISHPGYRLARVARDLPSGKETTVDIALSGAASLTGIVTSNEGEPLGHATVRIQGSDIKAAADDGGRFRVEGLVPGEVTATIAAKGYQPRQRTVELNGEESALLGKIALRPLEVDTEGLAKAFLSPADEGVIVADGVGTVGVSELIPRANFRTRLLRAGAKTGDVQVSLAWDNHNDIDLHVQAPSGEVIFFRNRHSRCGGELDVDMNAGGPDSDEPVENIYWPLNTAPRGKYKVLAHHYRNHGADDPTEFRVAVKNDDDVEYYTGKLNPDEKVVVCEFERHTGPEPEPVAEIAAGGGVGGGESRGGGSSGKNPRTVVGAGNGDHGSKSPNKKAAENQRSREDQAAQRLKLAKDLLDRNKTEAGKSWLEDVVKRYPETKSCPKAQELLDQLASREGKADAAGGVYLAELTPAAKNVGGSLQPRKVQIESEQKHHSLWTRTNVPNPPASVEYDLNRRYDRLSGAVGIDESGRADRTRVGTSFQIVGDGKVLWSSRNLRNPGQTQQFEVDVSGVDRLKILTDSNGTPSHYAVWVEPRLGRDDAN